MGTRISPWEGPDLRYGLRYVFDAAGDGISMHSHPPTSTWHYTECTKGSVEIYGDGVDAVVKAGEILAYPPFRMHEIVALEAGSEIINEFYADRPSDYVLNNPDLYAYVNGEVGGRKDFTWPNNNYRIRA
jgi:hypothetical protein